MIFMAKKNALQYGEARDKEDRRKFDQTFAAGKEAGLRQAQAAFWKRVGFYTGAIGAGSWAVYNFFGGVLKWFTSK